MKDPHNNWIGAEYSIVMPIGSDNHNINDEMADHASNPRQNTLYHGLGLRSVQGWGFRGRFASDSSGFYSKYTCKCHTHHGSATHPYTL